MDKIASGAQSIERALLLLRLIARSGLTGASLAELAAISGFTRPTAHRLLKALTQEGMLRFDPCTRRYQMGPLCFEFGLLAPSPNKLIETCRPAIKRIAAQCEDTVYLTHRSGVDGICIDLIEASYAIRALTIDVGGRRPLGVGATGLALLAALPSEEAEATLRSNASEYKRYGGLTESEVRKHMLETRKSGFGLSIERITPGVSGIGIAIPNYAGVPYVGISIASITARIIGERQNFLERILRREAEFLAKKIR